MEGLIIVQFLAAVSKCDSKFLSPDSILKDSNARKDPVYMINIIFVGTSTHFKVPDSLCPLSGKLF